MGRIKVQVPGGNFKSIQTGGGSTVIQQTVVQQRVSAPPVVSSGSAAATNPGGSDTYVQYNKASVFGGDANFTWNYTDQVLTISGASASSPGILVIEASSNAPWAINLRRTDLSTVDDVLMFNNAGTLQVDNAVLAPTFISNAASGLVLESTLTTDMYMYTSETISTYAYGTWWAKGNKGGYAGWGIDDGSSYVVFMSSGTAWGIYNPVAAKWLILGESGLTELGNGPVTVGTWEATQIGVAYGGTGITTTPTNGQLLIGNGSDYTAATLTAGAGITVTNGTGSISIAATGVGSTSGSYETSVSLTTGNSTVGSIASLAAGTYLCELYMYLSASASSAMTLSSSVSAGTITKETAGEVRVHNAANTVNNDLVNVMASGSFSIFSSTTQTVYGWGICVLSATATVTLSALVGSTATASYAGFRMTRIA